MNRIRHFKIYLLLLAIIIIAGGVTLGVMFVTKTFVFSPPADTSTGGSRSEAPVANPSASPDYQSQGWTDMLNQADENDQGVAQ